MAGLISVLPLLKLLLMFQLLLPAFRDYSFGIVFQS